MLKKLLIAALHLAGITALSAQTYYVSTAGNNGNPGTFSQPWATIQHALNTAGSGSDIWIRGGTYNEKLSWGASGSSGNPTALSNYNGELVVVSGTGINAPEAMLNIVNKSYVTVQGLTFANNYRQDARGIYVAGQGTEISISNCVVENIGFTSDPDTDPYSVNPNGQAHGILINGRTATGYTNIQVTGCTLRNLITGNSEALTLVGNNNGFTISGNTLYDNTNIGIDIAGHYTWAVDGALSPPLNQSRNGVVSGNLVYNHRRFSDTDAPPGLYADGSRDVVFEKNISHSNGVGISVGCENSGKTASNIVVRNNLVYNNDQNGVVFGANNGQIENCVFRNNTSLKNGSSGNFYSEIFLQNSTNCTIANNILFARSNSHYAIGIFSYTATNLTLTNEVHYRTGGNTTDLIVAGDGSALPVGAQIINANPLFVNDNASNPDLHIQAASPAVDHGDNSYLVAGETDFEGNARLSGTNVDCGADEMAMALAVEYISALQAKEVLPRGIELTWSVLADENAAHTEIERSEDGAHWQFLKRLPVTDAVHYHALDDRPFAGSNYYRLKQVEQQGSYTYSNIVYCAFSTVLSTVVAYPNPGSDFLRIKRNSTLPQLIQIWNSQGQFMQQLYVKGDVQDLDIHTSDWPSGHYIISVQDNVQVVHCHWEKY